MTVTIQAKFTKDIPVENQYRVQVSVTDATNIGLDVLVFDTESGEYSHVASVYDMETYPVSQEVAASGNLVFFRDRGAVVTYNLLKSADEFIGVTQGRLKTLANGWDEVVSSFSGTETVNVSSDTDLS